MRTRAAIRAADAALRRLVLECFSYDDVIGRLGGQPCLQWQARRNGRNDPIDARTTRE
jgi:hypothetical protein